ncbi:MAG: tetrapyrrole methylase family protein / MazG family protein [Clostridia bacterium]|nr:tetrapyrrole methylase family protein / MazG family protein [Clostridia bacterium]
MSSKIAVVGLGPGLVADIPARAWEAMERASWLVLRTAAHPAVKGLKERGFSFQTFDPLYEREQDFDRLYAGMVQELLSLARTGEGVYAVPGHPMVFESSVNLLLEKAPAAGVEVEIIPAMSCLDVIWSSLKLDPGSGILIADAFDLKKEALRPLMGLLLVQLYNRRLASDVKLTLMELYPDTLEVTLVRAAGVPGEEKIERLPLYKLDRVDWLDHLTSLYVPPYPKSLDRTLEGLTAIMARLRGEGGCPWDREQTHRSLERYLIEECYEVIEAIEAGDTHKLCEELGDLLLQVVFHARLAEEAGYFAMADVLAGICEKMRRRHPHVFGQAELKSSAQVLERWQEIKAREKGGNNETGVFNLPPGLPGLLKALKIQEQAARFGFDWPDTAGVWDKLFEEARELRQAVATGEKAQVEAEMGDLLFATVNLARWLGVEPERALNKACEKFRRRFRQVSREAREQGRSLKELSLEEMDSLWEKVKKNPDF